MTRGLLPLSADPVHNGHLDIIRRARAECDELLVAVLDNDEKRGSYTFDLPERQRLVERAIQQTMGGVNVRVVASSGLLVDLFLREGCDIVFRGIRDRKDREYEEWQMTLHGVILSGFERKVRYLVADPQFQHVSSSALKALVMHDADVSSMCPLFVKSKLERTLRKLYLLGVTGPMGVGKSWVSHELALEVNRRGVQAFHVNVDALLRQLYAEDSPGAQAVRDRIKFLLDVDIPISNGVADLSALKAAIKDQPDPEALMQVHAATEPHVYRLIRDALHGKRGLVLLEWARLAEDGMSRLVNHDAIIVTSPDQEANLTDRGADPDLVKALAANQWTAERKWEEIRRLGKEEGCGATLLHENQRGKPLGSLPDVIFRLFPGLGK